MAKKKGQTDNQRSMKRETINKRSSNSNPNKQREESGWTQVLQKGREYLSL
jgi:hypothetical protein